MKDYMVPSVKNIIMSNEIKVPAIWEQVESEW